MSRAKKIWLIAASALTVSGILLMVGALAAVGFDYKKLSTVSYLTVTEEISEEFDSVSIDVATADIEVIPSDGKDCRVVLYERKSDRFSASVEDKTLVSRRNGDKKWYEEIHIDFDSPKITAYLPKDKYDDFRIKCTTGDILIDSMEILNNELQFNEKHSKTFVDNPLTCRLYNTRRSPETRGIQGKEKPT